MKQSRILCCCFCHSVATCFPQLCVLAYSNLIRTATISHCLIFHSHYLYLSFSLQLSLILTASISHSHCLYLSLSLHLSLTLTASISHSHCIYLSFSLHLSLILTASISCCLSVYVSLSHSRCLFRHLHIWICVELYQHLSLRHTQLPPTHYTSTSTAPGLERGLRVLGAEQCADLHRRSLWGVLPVHSCCQTTLVLHHCCITRCTIAA